MELPQKILEQFPQNLQTPIVELSGWMFLTNQNSSLVPIQELRADVDELKLQVQQLRTDVDELKLQVQQLRIDVDELKIQVQQLRIDVDELKLQVQELRADVDELRSEFYSFREEVRATFQELKNQISALGDRWGIMNETMFRQTIRGIVKSVGYTTAKGYFGDREVDVVIRNGDHFLLEITSRLKRADVLSLLRSGEDYESKKNVKPKLLLAAITATLQAREELARHPDVRLYGADEDEEDRPLL